MAFLMVHSTWAGKRAPASSVVPADGKFEFIDAKRPECLEMVQGFCQTLFAPENQGSLRFNLGGQRYDIRLGETANDFAEKDFEFLKAKLHSWAKLPAEFRRILARNEFRPKLQRHLARVSRQHMTLKQRIDNMRNEEEINSIWNLAFREAVLTRMERSFPGYSRIKEDFMPVELRYEAERQRRTLTSKVAEALWTGHENWQNVVAKFAKVKNVYKQVLQEQEKLPEEIKKEWSERIEKVTLVVPGADPEVDMGSCFKNESNAYYFRDKNYITVCAGDFNTEEIEQTLAHELGHALDIGRTRHLFTQKSPLGAGLHELKEMSCSTKPFSCEHWRQTKIRFAGNLELLTKFEPQLKDFNQCLQEKPVKGPMSDEYITRMSKEEVESTVASLARRNVFLRIISPEMPLPDGSNQKNPMYMNPCGYYLWETQAQPLDDDVSLLLFFTAEYRCSQETDRAVKFKQSIESAKALQNAHSQAVLRMEGEFSSRYRITKDGYSSSPTERFADNLGQMVFARILNEEADVRRRRARYLANNAWLCRRPSIQQLFPGEAKIQRSYYVEAHSETNQRQKELLSEDIRKSLECKQDFSIKQCSLN